MPVQGRFSMRMVVRGSSRMASIVKSKPHRRTLSPAEIGSGPTGMVRVARDDLAEVCRHTQGYGGAPPSTSCSGIRHLSALIHSCRIGPLLIDDESHGLRRSDDFVLLES